ncbi:MAG TPA: phage holin family protein [Chitinophagaceae bacterium]|nr:phage holin family protein [Chitinophagaceae bacterium]
MNFIIELLVNAGVLFLLAALLPSVNIKSYGTAILVALVIGLLNATIGFLLRLPLNIITLGFLSFIVRLIVSSVMIKLADKLFSGFEVKGWGAAFLLALCIAIAGALLNYLLHPKVEETTTAFVTLFRTITG